MSNLTIPKNQSPQVHCQLTVLAAARLDNGYYRCIFCLELNHFPLPVTPPISSFTVMWVPFHSSGLEPLEKKAPPSQQILFLCRPLLDDSYWGKPKRAPH